MHYIPDVLVAEGVPGLYVRNPPPLSLRQEMTVSPDENDIPRGYWGPVRPESQRADGLWIYPSWA